MADAHVVKFNNSGFSVDKFCRIRTIRAYVAQIMLNTYGV